MYNQQPKRTIDFNTDPILNDINNIVKDGLTKLLDKYVDRYQLLERTHQAIMNLPSVMHELSNPSVSHNLSSVIEDKQNEKIEKDLQDMISANQNLLARVDILSKENEELTNELRELKKQLFHDTTDLSFDEVHIKVEPGVTIDSVEKENIRLEIEEQYVTDVTDEDDDSELQDEDEENEEIIDESDNAEDVLEADVQEELVDEPDDVLETDVQEELVDEDDVEEEDETDNVLETDVQEELVDEHDVEEEDEHDVEEEDEQEAEESVETEKSDSEEEPDEDEEIFEIDIDDITYCTNNEENGFIYELKDGEMGHKIGYLKEGEPFFYADEN
jgi:hypothetical protein